MRFRDAAVPLALGALLAALPAMADPRFDVIEPLEGATQSVVLGVSPDGCLVVGHTENEALRWRDGVSSRLLEDPDENPHVARAISPDGKQIGGRAANNQAFILLPPGSSEELQLLGGGSEVFQFGEHGYSVVGTANAPGNHGFLPFFAFTWGGSTPLSGGNGQARAIAGPFVAGWTSNGPPGGSLDAGLWYHGQAALWDVSASFDAPAQILGTLPGDTHSAVHGLSADGAVAVGRSYANTGSRAFRWTAAGGMVELAPGTEVANGVSADGLRVVGDGNLPGHGPTAFVWDARRGARSLADALRDEYGLDVGAFELLSATAVSPDGKTIVGTGVDAEGAPRGWRARLREERCAPQVTAVDLFAGYDGEPPIDEVGSLAVDSQGRVTLAGWRTGNVLRADPASAGAPPEEMLDFASSSAFLEVLAAGPDDSVYVAAYSQRRLLRIRPGGAVEVVLDTSSWPPLGTIEARPVGLAIAPDGTLFVGTWTRVLRIDPDGVIHELFDAATAGLLAGRPYALALSRVAFGSGGRLFVMAEYESTLFTLDAQSGALLAPPWRVPGGLPYFAPDPAGGVWLYGDGLLHVDAEGQVRRRYAYQQIPDGFGGKLERITALAGDAHGNAYYSGYPYSVYEPSPTGYSGQGYGVVRLSPDGHAMPVLTPDTLVDDGTVAGRLRPTLRVAGDTLYAVHDESDIEYYVCDPEWMVLCTYEVFRPPRLLRVTLPGGTACTNGLDDDGDGAADFPDDAGCLSPEDEGERSFEHPCDNGLDDDQDGVSDFPADPGCVSLTASQEKTECDDGLDNDADGNVDWDGGPFAAPADPECAGDPRRVIEHPWYCGLGFEVALVVVPLTQAARRWRRRRAAAV